MKIRVIFGVALFGVSAILSAQQAAPTAQNTAPAANVHEHETTIKLLPQPDAKLHENVLKLIELMDSRAKITEGIRKEIPKSREKLMSSSPTITDQFADEWVKRMEAEVDVDAYITVFVTAYEKHFDNEEIEELIQIQRDVNDKKTSTISDSLKVKLTVVGVALQSEIIGGCTQVGARQGGEIAQAIGKEHPEWLKTAPAVQSSQTKP